MNLAIHGIGANLGRVWGDTFARDLHPDVKADFVHGQPALQHQGLGTQRERRAAGASACRPPGTPTTPGSSTSSSKLAPGGSAGVVMANGSMSTNSGGEGQIRAQIVEADLVSCMVALPTQLFRSTGIPVCVWFFAKDKRAGKRGSIDRTGQVLFIDARNLGYMVDRAERSLTDDDIASDRRHLPRVAGDRIGGGEGADVRGCAGVLLLRDAGGDQGRRLRADAWSVRRCGGVAEEDEPIDERSHGLRRFGLAVLPT